MSWVTVIGRILFTRGDRLVVASTLGAEKLSLYSIFSDFSVAISGFSSMLIQPITPVISNELTLLGSTSYKLPLIIRNAMRWSFLSALFLGLSMLIISPLILKLCGDSILSYENLLGFRLLISITTVISLSAVGYWFLFASREVGISMVIYLISGFISLVLIYRFSSSFGLIGAITGNIGYAGTLYLSFLALKRVNMKSYQLLIYLAITVIVIFFSFLLLTIAKI
jgi:O-antigen/teichoic acid export membrane protein